jgi:hypothetical protein
MKKWIIKIGFCIFAWIVLFFMFNFVIGNNNWWNTNNSFPRFFYLMVSVFSNALIIGGEYLL